MSLELNKIYQGDSLEVLKTFPDESVDCCITSPPYWGLRDYGTAKWEGGDGKCDHKGVIMRTHNKLHEGQPKNEVNRKFYKETCGKCGAKRVDSQLGLEKTPEEYVGKMVELFREVRRVLKKEGVMFLNLGDSYATHASGSKKTGHNFRSAEVAAKEGIGTLNRPFGKQIGLKEKDLIGIPWRVVFALRQDGWYLRQDIIWHKPNPMPESVRDRCTKAHEYIFLMSKSPKYYFDGEAIREPYTAPMNRWGGQKLDAKGESKWDKGTGQVSYRNRDMRPNSNGRNRRSVWTIATRPFKGAHFATFPEALITPMVLAGCPKNGLCLDPFMGAGTTGLVAKKLGRNYVGIELNPEYIKMAEARIGNVLL